MLRSSYARDGASGSGGLAMRKALIAVVFSGLFTANANAFEQGGVIVSVDPANETFTLRWATADRTYKAGDKMVIRVGQKKGAWSDLKVAQKSMSAITLSAKIASPTRSRSSHSRSVSEQSCSNTAQSIGREIRLDCELLSKLRRDSACLHDRGRRHALQNPRFVVVKAGTIVGIPSPSNRPADIDRHPFLVVGEG